MQTGDLFQRGNPMTDNPNPASALSPEEELKALRLEVSRLKRRLTNVVGALERNKITGRAKQNISAMVTAEKTKQERYMNLLLENCPDIIILLDQDGRFLYCTDTFLRRAHIPNFGLINGRYYKEVFSRFAGEDWLERVGDIFLEAMRTKTTAILEETADIGNDGHWRNYNIHFTPMENEDGEVEGAMALFHDLTEVIQAKDQAERAKEQAELASTAKSDFLANMSHEMRTPMNAIIGMTSIAKTSEDIIRKDYCLDKIDEASTHLLGVINDILDMSKIEAGKFELSHDEFEFEKMLMKVANVLSFRIDERKQTFFIYVDPDIPRSLVTDEQRLSQVITNLLSNAVKFTPEGGTITLSALMVGEEAGLCTLEISVTDNGIGISEEQQQRLFKSFEQADSGISRRFGGTGLGLAISKSIVEMMNGRIWVESHEGEGSTFIFNFKARQGSLTKQGLLSPDINWKNLRTLAVDDSEAMREYFVSISQSLGFYCDVAASGEEAIRRIHEDGPYNIVFIDWKMPDMNGIELTRAIKGGIDGNPTVVLMSATEWSRIEHDAKAAGVDMFMPKPIFSSMIVDCINECLGADQDVSTDALDPASYTDCFVGRRILLAEDIEINREIVMALLDPTGINIDCAENGREAYEKFEANPTEYDLVFMDIHMPEVDGYEATRMIRALDHPEAQSVPIVAMTANVFREDVEKCLAAGMDDHVGKPLDMEEVIIKLRKHLPSRSQVQE